MKTALDKRYDKAILNLVRDFMNYAISAAAALFGIAVGLATMAFISAPQYGGIPALWLAALAIGGVGGFAATAVILIS